MKRIRDIEQQKEIKEDILSTLMMGMDWPL